MYCRAPVLLNGTNVTLRIRVDRSYAILLAHKRGEGDRGAYSRIILKITSYGTQEINNKIENVCVT